MPDILTVLDLTFIFIKWIKSPGPWKLTGAARYFEIKGTDWLGDLVRKHEAQTYII